MADESATQAEEREAGQENLSPRRVTVALVPLTLLVPGKETAEAEAHDELQVWGNSIALPPDRLARTKIFVDGLRVGTRVRVLFEDREVTAADGHFVDDFRGRDLYQRFGGGPMLGYGDAPVAVHAYEIGGARPVCNSFGTGA